HPAKTSRKRYAFGMTFKQFADLSGDWKRSPEQIMAALPFYDFNAAQNVVDGLLFESGNAEQLSVAAERFKFTDGFDAEPVIDVCRRLRPDAGHGDEPQQPERDFLFEFVIELHRARSDVLRDFAGEVRADSGNFLDRATRDHR